MIKTNSKSVFGLVTGLVIALTLIAGSAFEAKALTASDIDLLVAMGIVSADKAASAKAALVTTQYASLKVGSTGAEVSALQNMLVSGGYLVMPAGVKTGYYGKLTADAFAKYQAAQAAVVTTTTTTTTTTSSSDLKGTDGSIAKFDNLSQYSNEEVGESQTDVKVAGVEVKASKDGDIAFKSMKLLFNDAGATGGSSTRLNKYIDTVKIWAGSKEVGSADVADFNKDETGKYSKTITLSSPVVKADQTVKFYITVDSASNLDTNDINNDSWTVAVENARYIDGSGVVTTEDTTDTFSETPINFVSYSSAADTKLKITKDSSSPVEGIVMVDDNNTTDDVVLLKGKIKLEGTSDVTINELPIEFTTTADSLAAITGSVKLTIDGQEFTKSVNSTSTTATTTFDNLDLNVNAGDTVSFTVSADINDIEAPHFVVGDTLKASLTTNDQLAMDVENSEGDQLSTGEKTGTVSGLAQAFYTEGISASFVSSKVTTVTSADVTASSSADTKTFEIVYNVKAIGEDVYIDKDVVASSSSYLSGNGHGTAFATTTDSSANVTGAGLATISASGSTSDDSATNYKINSGETRTFTLDITLKATANGYTAVQLDGINWSLNDDTASNYYTFNLSDFKTSKVYMTKI